VVVITRNPLARAAAAVVLAGALLVGTAGCTFISRQATLIQYDPSDGVGADIGNVRLLNVIGIVNEDGHAISLLLTMVNSGTKIANVGLQFESGGEKITVTKSVRAGETVTYGTTPDDPNQIVILNPDIPAGALLPVYVQYGDNPGVQMLVPVLEATGPYEKLAPPEILRDK